MIFFEELVYLGMVAQRWRQAETESQKFCFFVFVYFCDWFYAISLFITFAKMFIWLFIYLFLFIYSFFVVLFNFEHWLVQLVTPAKYNQTVLYEMKSIENRLLPIYQHENKIILKCLLILNS